MVTFNDDGAAINLKIMKQCGFYQIFDPKSKKIFGWNVYLLSFITLTVITQCALIFGNCGFLMQLDDTINIVDVFLIIYYCLLNYLNLGKNIILMFKRNKILELLDVTDLQFLKSKQCRNNIKILYKHRNRILRLTNFFLNILIFGIVGWVLSPTVINYFKENKNENERLESILNWRFPVNVTTYNQYYGLIYVLELLSGMQTMYITFLIDILLLSVGWAISIQYELLAKAFENIGHHVQKGETIFFTFITIYCIFV